VRQKKGSEPPCGGVFRQLKQKGGENRIEKSGKGAYHYQDLETNYEIKHNCAAQDCLSVHMKNLLSI
jgi:hypothetical protein